MRRARATAAAASSDRGEALGRNAAGREAVLLDAVDEQGILDLLRALVAADSQNPPGNEESVARVVAGALADAGLPVELDEVAPGRPNVYAAVGDGRGRHLVLNAHLDTMPAGPGWSDDPLEPRMVEDGRALMGRGAADAKGGLAAMVGALLAFARSGLPIEGMVTLQAVCDEEGEGAGSRAAVERLRFGGRPPDWAVLAEPTSCRVARASNGQVNVELVFHGIAAHGSAPGEGRNAVHDAAAFVLLVEEAAGALAAGAATHPLLRAATYNTGTIAGGLQTSIVPARCVVTLDRRIMPGQSIEDAVRDVDQLLERLAALRPGAQVDRRVLLGIPPVDVPETVDVCSQLLGATRDVRGEGTFIGLTATSDAATYAAAGIPAVVFGPGSMSTAAHRPDERVDLREVFDAARVLALVIERLVA